MHHLRRLRISVSGGHPAPADDHRPAPRRREHRQVGGRVRQQAVPEPGAQRQRAGLRRRASARSSSRRTSCRSTTARRSTACGWDAWARTIRRAARSWLALVELLRHLGVTFGVLRKEKCTGDPARRLGNDLASLKAGRGEHRVPLEKVTKMVSIARIACARSATDWREAGARRSRSSTTASCWRGIASRLPEGGDGSKMVYHDPCYLGRYRDIYDEPRAVAARYGEVVEPRRAARAPSAAAPAAARCSWARRRASG